MYNRRVVEKEGKGMRAKKGMGVAPKKPFSIAGYVKAPVYHFTQGRADLKPGDTIYTYLLGEGEGHNYTQRKLHVIGETDCLYICEYRGKYARYKECVLKSDYRLGLGVEKAN